MNFFERTPSANITDKILDEQERFLRGPVFLPISESKYLGAENDPCANGPAPIVSTKSAPIDTHEVAPAVEANSDIPQLEHIVTDPRISTIPGDEASIPSSRPSKGKSLFGDKGIVICAMLSLATGIAVGAAWSRTRPLTENWKSYNLRGVEAIFADSSKGQLAAQAAPAAAVVTAPDVGEILNQLNAIARDLSTVQQNINELAAGHEQMRKTQGQLAEAQSHLAALQAQAYAKQNKQSAPAATAGRKFYRRDYRNMSRYPPSFH
jgi:hypothetical protein